MVGRVMLLRVVNKTNVLREGNPSLGWEKG